MNDSFVIRGLGGKKRLSGTVHISGAKNAALPALAASILFTQPVRYKNVPKLLDVDRMLALIRGAGASVGEGDRVVIDPAGISSPALDRDIACHMRASVILIGPLLGRLGSVSFPHPGGCVIGERPIDIFLEGFARMGATAHKTSGGYVLVAKKGLRGADIFLKMQSVTATETFMLSAVLAQGVTRIQNAAMEPEITDLAAFLAQCGARIVGAGTPTVTIRGTGLLRANRPHYRVIPDRIEAGSFLLLGALAARNLTIRDCVPAHLEAVCDALVRAGVPLSIGKDVLRIRGNTKPNRTFRGVDIKTHEYPGFPTDLQAPMTVFLTQVAGDSLVFETIFEGRLNYADDLVNMGADISLWNPHKALVRGPRTLLGRTLEGPDIRAGLAFVIAAIVSKGRSEIRNLHFVDRGYERLDEKLRKIGVDIRRITG